MDDESMDLWIDAILNRCDDEKMDDLKTMIERYKMAFAVYYHSFYHDDIGSHITLAKYEEYFEDEKTLMRFLARATVSV